MSIGFLIRKMRQKQGYSQEYLAQRLNVTQSSYCKIENDEVKVKAETLIQISKILDTDVNSLLYEEGQGVHLASLRTGYKVAETAPAKEEHPLYERLLRSKEEQLTAQEHLLNKYKEESVRLKITISQLHNALYTGLLEATFASESLNGHEHIRELTQYLRDELRLWSNALLLAQTRALQGLACGEQPGESDAGHLALTPGPASESSGELVYTSDHIDMAYFPEERYLYVNWKGFQTAEDVKRGCQQMLALLEELNCTRILNDNRQVVGPWQDAAEWGSREWFPQLQRAGLTHFAWVVSPSLFCQLSMEKTLSGVKQTSVEQIRTFEDIHQAIDWIAAP